MSRVARWVALTMLVAVSAAFATAYARYGNARYGYSIDYPAAFVKAEAPANNDGRTFTGPDGASMTVFGMNNVTHQTLQGAYHEVLAEKGKAVEYKTAGENWFVVSWRSEGRVFYQKQYVGRGSMCAFILSYPVARASNYAAVASHVERSFRHGNLAESH